MRIVIQLIVLTVLWAVFGGLTVWLHPDAKVLMAGGPPAAAVREGEVTLGQAQELQKKGNVLWIDVRPAEEFVKGTIPGAENIPYDKPDALRDALFLWTQSGRLTHETQVVVFCSSAGCTQAHELRNELLRKDDQLQVHVLAGGWPEWRREQERLAEKK